MPSRTAFNFELSLEELPSLEERYRSCTSAEERILNQIVHDPSFFERHGSLPPRYQDALESLRGESFIRRSEDGKFEVVPDLVYLPKGPGLRRDQLSGVLHRLDGDDVRGWYYALTGQDGEGESIELVHRRVASEILSADRDASDDPGSVSKWIAAGELSGDFTGNRNDFYAALESVDSSYCDDLLWGRFFPVWNESGDLLGLVRADRNRIVPTDPESNPIPEVQTEEKQWDRSPFNVSEQVKVTQILSDALPVRLTEESDPHRFDLKEASRITGWSLGHVDFLTKLLVEQQFLLPAEDRFYISERYESWEAGGADFHPFLTGLNPGLDGGDVHDFQSDFSFGAFLHDLLQELETLGDGFTVDDADLIVTDRDYTFAGLMSGSLHEESLELERRKRLDQSLDLLFRLGFLDRWNEDEVRYRLNDRGRAMIEGEADHLTIDEGLPLILQPDGQLMVPLERPVNTFRHVNPFGLVVKVDRMIVYQVDDKSLVQALNEGWDAGGFRRFLEENVRELPNPMEELFGDILEGVEDVAIEDAHHLLRFETGATAAKAMNILNNYNPARIDETTLILRSETNEETIRRNLSRGGVRLGTDSDRGSNSPVLEL